MRGRGMLTIACCLLIGGSALQSCEDNDLILTGQPEWLGNSIYERLQEDGHYKNMLRLIDDQGQKEVLSRTGSKTLFVADDAAFDEWFKSNDWGVSVNWKKVSGASKYKVYRKVGFADDQSSYHLMEWSNPEVG